MPTLGAFGPGLILQLHQGLERLVIGRCARDIRGMTNSLEYTNDCSTKG